MFRLRPHLFHEVAQKGGVGLHRGVGQGPLHHVEHAREIVLHHRTRQGVGLVGQHRQTHPLPLQRRQKLGYAGIGGGLVLLVLAVIGGELRQRARQRLPVRPGGDEPLHQLGDAVSHHAFVRVHRMDGPAVGGAYVIARVRQIIDGVQKGAVQVKNHVSNHKISFSPPAAPPDGRWSARQ